MPGSDAAAPTASRPVAPHNLEFSTPLPRAAGRVHSFCASSTAIGLIQEAQAGDEPERVREGMSGNLCRCGAYRGITEAVLEAQKVLDAAGRREVA